MIRVGLDRVLDPRAGRIWSGGDAMVWHPLAGVVGFTLPRRLSAESLMPIAAVSERLIRARRAPCTLVFDVSRVAADGVDEMSLSSFHRFVVEPLAAASARVRAAHVVGGAGLGQCALIGLFTVTRPAFAWTLHAGLDQALATLGAPARPFAAELLGAIHSELTPLGLVSRVRAAVGAAPAASMRTIAQRMRIAPRTLQRALADAATTFHDERSEVRLELAASRLSRTADKVSTIARDVGYASLPHFMAVFRARFALTPVQFRLAYRMDGAEP